MITNQKLKNALEEIKEITKLDAQLYSPKGKFVTATCEPFSDGELIAKKFILIGETPTAAGCGCFDVSIDEELEYVLIISGAKKNTDITVIGQMAACQIRNLILGESEKYNRNNFVQNIILGNMLNADIMTRAKKLHIDNKPRCVFVIDTGKSSNEIALKFVRNLSDMKSGDFVASVDEHSVVLVKDMSDLKPDEYENELAEIANGLVDNLLTEAMIKVRVGYGNIKEVLFKIADSYQEAMMALQVGKVFYAEREVISYDKLGVGRLIYQLPMSLCDMFIKEVFGDAIPEILDDEEAMSTVAKFFENNLNISETARQLFVHRNTLVYRLERIEKAIGLDIKSFDDAMIFKLAVMVLAHIKDSKKELE